MAVHLLCTEVLLPGLGNTEQSFFYKRFVRVHVMHPYSSMDTAIAWKQSRFLLSDRLDLHMIDWLSITLKILA